MKRRNLIKGILVFSNLFVVLCAAKKEIPERISEGVAQLKDAKTSSILLEAFDDFRQIENKSKSNSVFCDTCQKVFGQIIDHRKSGASKDSMITFFKKMCYVFTDWRHVVCDGYINIEIDTVLYIVDNKKDLTPERVCAIVFQHKNCQDPNANNWNIDIVPSNHIPDQEKETKNLVDPFKILHLTDIHYDPLYKPGTNADCELPLCCQDVNGPPLDPEKAAGYWGDYHVCDTPWHAITDLMNHINIKHEDIDAVYFTGDIISHKSWATTKNHNVEAIRSLYKLFNDTFKDVSVYPILGNHEPHPTDFYSPGNVASMSITTQWVFDLAAEEWSQWLPEDTKETIRIGGYYTVVVRPGFRIIALNSNICFTSNLWLLYDDEDPYGQLKWLTKTLTKAEQKKEKVHILSHIPSGETTCYKQWAHQFRRIVNRFASTISGQFNGHTHLDELRVFYDLNDSNKVVNVAFNGGSLTSFIGYNPNYRLYDVDSTTLRVLDYDQYTFNLTKANQDKSKSPQWYKLYSFKQAYGLQNTEMENYADLVTRMASDKKLVEQYYRFQVRNSDIQMAKGCDEKCLLELICSITSVEPKESIQCIELKKNYFRNKLSN